MDVSRSEILLGKEGVERLLGASVVIFGVGGVGSYAAEAIARSGVGHITLVDFDVVSPSNVNRQLPATAKTVGEKKVRVMAERIREINPSVCITEKDIFCTPENVDAQIPENCDYCIDAIDTVSAKIAIIEACTRRDIPVISCMGAGNKLDPTAFRVADIYKTSVCPLCRVMRRELRARGIPALQVVYSEELPKKGEDSTIGSLPFVPSVAGLVAAGHVILKIAGKK